MTPIKPRQEAFCQNYIRTANAASAATQAGYAPRTARKQGSRLLSDERVQARITELRSAIASQHCADADQLMAKLEAVFCQAVEGHQWSAAVRAVNVQAQLAGLMPRSRRRAETAPMDDNEPTGGRCTPRNQGLHLN